MKHESKTCPRCNKEFECKSGSILLCQCQTVIINAQQLDYISQRYDDCLCASCLAQLRTEHNLLQHQSRLEAYQKNR